MNSIAATPTAPFRRLQKIVTPDADVKILQANLGTLSAEEEEPLAATLNPAEHERARQFHFERDRKRYIAARGLLRHLLGRALMKSPSSLRFENVARGKPRLVAETEATRRLCFNLSHSGDQALFAFAWNRELGIDIESTERAATIDESDNLAQRVLAKEEWELWRALPDITSRRAIFFRAWVRKEAFVKATGEGLASDLRSVVVMASNQMGEIAWKKTINGWSVHDLAAPPGYVAAVTVAQAEN